MTDGFEVKGDVLNRLAGDLQNVTDVMSRAMDAMESRDGAGSLGTGDLDDAAKGFKDSWKYGLGKLKDDLSDTTKNIGATAKQYDASEADIVRALNEYRLPT
ncbi:MAG: hypothetical protein ACRDRN_28820 [Sciscionella sp.]